MPECSIPMKLRPSEVGTTSLEDANQAILKTGRKVYTREGNCPSRATGLKLEKNQ